MNTFFCGTQGMRQVVSPGTACPEKGKTWRLGVVEQACDLTNDTRVSGELTLEYNAYLDEAGACGPLWGTFVLENPGGKWLAAWIGQKTGAGITIQALGYGADGYEGLLANWTYIRPGSSPEAPCEIRGFIVHTGPDTAAPLEDRPEEAGGGI